MAKRWYVAHVHSGFEKRVAQAIQEQVESHGLSDLVDEILVPTEEVVEVRRGAKVNSERKFFPGYVLVKMELTDESWHLVQDHAKVTGFLGPKGKPSPITDKEAQRLIQQVAEGVERPKSRLSSISASRCAFATVLSPRSTAMSRISTRRKAA